MAEDISTRDLMTLRNVGSPTPAYRGKTAGSPVVSPSDSPAETPPAMAGTTLARAGPTFAEILARKAAAQPQSSGGVQEGGTGSLSFSSHAARRMADRKIPFGPGEARRLETLVEGLRTKGSRDALVVMDGNGFVVSVKNSTVVTVVDRGSMKGSAFTNIDSTIFG